MKDYYRFLGVEKSASDEEIKKAYRKLAHQYHPDKTGGDANKFKEINEAYQILSNQEKRSQYDRFGRVFSSGGDDQSGGSPFGGFEFGFDPSNLEDVGNISDIFDAFFEGLGVKKRKTYRRGADLEVVQEISLEEAFSGAAKTISIKTFVSCGKCSGIGYFEKEGLTTCSACDGRGEIRESRSTFFGNFSQIRACAKCGGAGQIPNKHCSVCRGSGRLTGEKNLTIDIAPGVSDSQLLKISKEGEVGERGADKGDLYVRIKIKPHKIFERRNNDLVIKKEIGFVDAVLGNKIEISEISGQKLYIEIPPGFNLRETLKIPGHGMNKFGGFGRGDLLIEWQIKTPRKINPKAKKLLEELNGEFE